MIIRMSANIRSRNIGITKGFTHSSLVSWHLIIFHTILNCPQRTHDSKLPEVTRGRFPGPEPCASCCGPPVGLSSRPLAVSPPSAGCLFAQRCLPGQFSSLATAVHSLLTSWCVLLLQTYFPGFHPSSYRRISLHLLTSKFWQPFSIWGRIATLSLPRHSLTSVHLFPPPTLSLNLFFSWSPILPYPVSILPPTVTAKLL